MLTGEKSRIGVFKTQTISATGSVTSTDFVHQTHFQAEVSAPTERERASMITTREVS